MSLPLMTLGNWFVAVWKGGRDPHIVPAKNKPENQDEDALGKIEQQQDFVILNLTLRVLDND